MIFASITTDWIQAIGILISIPAATWGIVNLFKKDKNRQKEIESLTSLAQSQAGMIEKISEQIEFERHKYLNIIKPFFVIRYESILGHIGMLEFTNTGKTAMYKGLRQIVNFNYSFTLGNKMNQFVETNDKMYIEVTGHKNEELSYKAVIYFQDIEGNNYYQKFIGQNDNIYPESPVLYSGDFSDIKIP
jgi:hypothetical protein